ncbi:hypothetical protein ACKGJN_01105 [Gillisia sp. Q332]|uniref:hypothetical protein n=1 Tax=Gillisia xinjiangensis TaxID=3384765 RepID=UPI00391E024B
MKNKLKYIAFLLLASIVVVSCDYDENNYESLIGEPNPNATYYIQFNDAAQLFETSFDPDGGTVDVETTVAVKLLGLPQAEAITVGLSLASTSDITSEMFELGTTSLVIPAGETSASTTLTIFSDMLPVDETSSLVLNIDAGANTATAGEVLTYNVFRTPPCIPTPGEYRIVMIDSYGDGWQTTSANGGAGITLEVDGVQIAEVGLCSPYEATFPTCTAELASGETTVTIPEGSQFAKWTFPGDNWGEIEYEIYDPNGVLVASANAGEGVAGTIDVQACVEEEEVASE